MPDPAIPSPSRSAPFSFPYARHPRALTRAAALLGFLGLASCTPQEGALTTDVEVVEVPVPAGEGSGEPFLSSSGDTANLSWLERTADGSHALRLARLRDGAWSEPVTVAQRPDFFVNWADFPSVVPGPDGALWAHWLEKGDEGGYDYGVRVVTSDDGGATWSDPVVPHEDGTPQEHGFVSLLPVGQDMGVVWLDGRRYERGPNGGAATDEMTLRFRTLARSGEGGPVPTSPETLLDPRTCDCCQTAAVSAPDGPVVFYRDRSQEEIRDIFVTRWHGGAWSDPVPVARDGWVIGGCPVNGPAADARDARIAVAWFTAADDEPRVKVAFSDDGGATFAAPIRIDDGNPSGRVDLLLRDDGRALVSWLERTGGEAAEVRMRSVAADGTLGPAWAVTRSSAARASGFPRMIPSDDSSVLLAWTDAQGDDGTRVRVARVEAPIP